MTDATWRGMRHHEIAVDAFGKLPLFTRLPRILYQAPKDNLALVSGELLPFPERCQELANRLPNNGVLVVAPG